METTAQAFIFNFDKHQDTCAIAAAVIMRDGALGIGGLVGYIPGPAATKMFYAARDAGVKVVRIKEDNEQEIIALVWGDIDLTGRWDLIAHGIAMSMTKAFLQSLADAQDFSSADLDRDSDEIPF